MSSKIRVSKKETDLIGNNLRTFLLLYEQFAEGTGKNKKLKSLREIGEILGWSKQMVGRWFRGEHLTFDLLYRLHIDYNLNINWLFTGKGDPLSKG